MRINPRTHRQLLFTVSKAELEGISGVILFHETIFQKSDSGKPFIDLIKELGIVPGIKVGNLVISSKTNSKLIINLRK